MKFLVDDSFLFMYIPIMEEKNTKSKPVSKEFDKAARVLTFVPLDKENLQQAIDMAVAVFGEGDREGIVEEFSGSLDPNTVHPYIATSSFFMVLNNGQPAGVTGFYSVHGQPHDIWLNWMGVLPEARGHNIGQDLVQQGFIDKASAGIKTLRIWTTLEPDYESARKLYNRMGFKEESYRPGATDAAKTVVVYSKSTDPKAKADFSWKKTGYSIDCEMHVIPDLNKKFGFKADKKSKLPKPPSP